MLVIMCWGSFMPPEMVSFTFAATSSAGSPLLARAEIIEAWGWAW
jgi:hypothetical protein